MEFGVDELTRVPRRLHQIWMQGEAHLPERLVELQHTWRELNPHYEYRLWDEAALRELIATRQPWFLPTWERYRYLHQRADAGRLFVLYEYGGFYVDLDARALRPLDQLIALVPDARLIMSELPFAGLDRAVIALACGTGRLITNAIVGMEPGLQEWLEVLQRLTGRPAFLQFNKELLIAFGTGPMFLSGAVDRAFAGCRDSVAIMPARMFERRLGYQPYFPAPREAFMDHLMDASWHSPWLQRLLKLYYGWFFRR